MLVHTYDMHTYDKVSDVWLYLLRTYLHTNNALCTASLRWLGPMLVQANRHSGACKANGTLLLPSRFTIRRTQNTPNLQGFFHRFIWEGWLAKKGESDKSSLYHVTESPIDRLARVDSRGPR